MCHFDHAMFYATVCRLSVRLSVRLFSYRDHIGWNTSKIILWLISLIVFHLPPTWAIWCIGNTPKRSVLNAEKKIGHSLYSSIRPNLIRLWEYIHVQAQWCSNRAKSANTITLLVKGQSIIADFHMQNSKTDSRRPLPVGGGTSFSRMCSPLSDLSHNSTAPLHSCDMLTRGKCTKQWNIFFAIPSSKACTTVRSKRINISATHQFSWLYRRSCSDSNQEHVPRLAAQSTGYKNDKFAKMNYTKLLVRER